MLFAEGEDGRIPIVAVTGTNGKTTVSRLIAHILAASDRKVGLTCTDGIYVGRAAHHGLGLQRDPRVLGRSCSTRAL